MEQKETIAVTTDAEQPSSVHHASTTAVSSGPRCSLCPSVAVYFADPRTAKPSSLAEHAFCEWHWEHSLAMAARTALDASEDQQRTGAHKTLDIMRHIKSRYRHGGN